MAASVIERVTLTPGYSVSRMIHGGWQFSTGHRLGGPEMEDALELLVASADLGVTTFDCADIYTSVEELYGRFLARWKTTSSARPLQIHTKLVPDYGDLERVDRRYVENIVDRSLSRLGVETLDLVQFYWWRDDVPGMEEMAKTLDDLRRAGKVRHLAATNMDVDRLERIRDAGVRLVANQVQYSALDRRPESTLSRYAEGEGMGLLCFGTLAGGFLTGRGLGAPDTEAVSRSQVKYRLIVEEFGGWAAYQALLAEIAAIAANHRVTPAAVATRFVLEQPSVAAVIVGATRSGQMARNAEAFTFALTEMDHARIREHTGRAPGPAGPVFGLESDRDGAHGRIMRYDLNRLDA